MAKAGDWGFIINPIAGNGYGKESVPRIEAMLKKHNIKAELLYTKRHRHATELAEQLVQDGFQYVVAVGGDGTINQVAQALINQKDVIMGTIPAGTGNDFIQILGFPGNFSDADWDVFFEKNIINMDVGRCNNSYFLNGMGLGFDAQVAAENYTEDQEVKSGSTSKYWWHILKTLLFYKEKKMITTTDNQQQETNCFINTISIGRRFAGSFFLTPKAIANDGLLDVCSIRELSFLQRLKVLLQVPKGTHITNENVHYYQTDQLSLEFKTEVPHHLDGELFYAKQFDVSLLKASLPIIYNPHGEHYFK